MSNPARSLAVLVCAAVMAALACGSDDDNGEETATPPPGRTASVTADSTDTPSTDTPLALDVSIRELELASVPDVQALETETGGSVVQADVLYADLTEDNVEEAIVPIASGGTLGNVAFIVLTPAEGGTETLLSEQADAGGGMVVAVDAGQLVVTQPVFAPEDAECCPSLLRRTTYGWNGAALALENDTTEPNPDAGAKPTQSP